MKYRPGSGATERGRRLRHNATEAEQALWRALRTHFPDARFRRQVPLRNYTIDFASHRARLVIEVDGGQHDAERDAERTAAIEAEGYVVLRFWNHEVLGNIDGVSRAIEEALAARPLPSMGTGWGGVASPDQARQPGPCSASPRSSLTPPPPQPSPIKGEVAFIAGLRGLATHPAARGLRDDAAVLEFAGRRLVLTHDVLAEGVHYLAEDPPADVAWKLLAVNLSDLAAKGARPLGVLLGYPLAADSGWDEAFVAGLREALAAFDVPLLGGDTVAAVADAPRMLGLTAIGEAEVAPSRTGARAGDQLWISGTIGDAGAGLRIASGAERGPPALAQRYRRPTPRLALGQALAPHVSAMMDVSDGLLIDAGRMAEASGVACTIHLDHIPLSDDLRAFFGDNTEARLRAATAGDDYELLFTAPPAAETALLEASAASGTSIKRIGQVDQGSGLSLFNAGEPLPLPARLGWEHEVAPGGG